MMDNKFIGLMVGLTVGVLMVSGFLWPIVSDATATEETFTNDGYYRLSEFDGESAYTITWEPSKPLVLTINGVDHNMGEILTVKDQYFTIYASDGAYMRCAISTTGGSAHMIVQSHNSAGDPLLAFDTNNTTTISVLVTIDNGTITTTRSSGGDPITVTANYSEFMYVFDPEGYYIMKDRATPAYVTNDEIIILAGVTNVSSTPVGVYGHGTIDNLVIESAYPDDNTVYSNIVVDYEEVAGYEELNKVGNITFDMTRDSAVTNATYSYYLVPYEVTAEKSWHLDTTQIALVAAIGTLGAIVLIAAAAGSIRRLE